MGESARPGYGDNFRKIFAKELCMRLHEDLLSQHVSQTHEQFQTDRVSPASDVIFLPTKAIKNCRIAGSFAKPILM